MGSCLVVVEHPPVRGLAYVVESGEQVLVQHFLTEGPVEAFDVGVLIWLARLDVADGDTVGLGPGGECLAQELRSVVRAKHLR